MILCVCPNPSIDTYSSINQLIPGQVNRILDQKEFPGGKGVHVALGLKELGENAYVYGIWGGSAGNWLKEKCRDVGITCLGTTVNGMSRKCYTFITEEKKSDLNNTELLEPGPVITPEEYTSFMHGFERVANHATFVCLSGSWPKGRRNRRIRKLIDQGTEKWVRR